MRTLQLRKDLQIKREAVTPAIRGIEKASFHAPHNMPATNIMGGVLYLQSEKYNLRKIKIDIALGIM